MVRQSEADPLKGRKNEDENWRGRDEITQSITICFTWNQVCWTHGRGGRHSSEFRVLLEPLVILHIGGWMCKI
jgi:hypothetical protein